MSESEVVVYRSLILPAANRQETTQKRPPVFFSEFTTEHPESRHIIYVLNANNFIFADVYAGTTVDIICINHASANHHLYL